jgi:hypothetical protein
MANPQDYCDQSQSPGYCFDRDPPWSHASPVHHRPPCFYPVHAAPGVLPGVPLRTLYNAHKLDNPVCLQKFQAQWRDNLPSMLTAFQQLDRAYLAKQILEQEYVDHLTTIVDAGLAKSCASCLGLRQPHQPSNRHPFLVPVEPMTPDHALARAPLLRIATAANRAYRAAPWLAPDRPQLLRASCQRYAALRAADTAHANLALLRRMASYDVSITPATPALSIRRKKIAPLPMQLRKNPTMA